MELNKLKMPETPPPDYDSAIASELSKKDAVTEPPRRNHPTDNLGSNLIVNLISSAENTPVGINPTRPSAPVQDDFCCPALFDPERSSWPVCVTCTVVCLPFRLLSCCFAFWCSCDPDDPTRPIQRHERRPVRINNKSNQRWRYNNTYVPESFVYGSEGVFGFADSEHRGHGYLHGDGGHNGGDQRGGHDGGSHHHHGIQHHGGHDSHNHGDAGHYGGGHDGGGYDGGGSGGGDCGGDGGGGCD